MKIQQYRCVDCVSNSRWYEKAPAYSSVLLLLLALLVVTAGMAACDAQGEGEELAQDIHVSEQRVEFGHVPVGSSATQTVEVHNLGAFDIVFSQVPEVSYEGTHEPFNLDATWMQLPGDEPSTAAVGIAPGTYEEMTITYTPAAEEESYAYIELYNNDPDEANRFVVLHGSSREPVPGADVTPNAVDFGHVPSGTTAEEVVEIHNVGEVDVEVVAVTVNTGPFVVAAQPDAPIPPGGTDVVTVQFDSDGDHAIGLITVEIAGDPNTVHAVGLSANSPGSISNSAPEVSLIEPTVPTVFHADQDLDLLAEAFDDEQPDIGLFCTLESNRLGIVELETSDPVASEVHFVIGIEESNFANATGLHTLLLCCADVYNEAACLTTVVSIDQSFSDDDADGDGYAPSDGDCDDTDPDSYPAAIELLDTEDNDCDGATDEDCIDDTSTLAIIGGIQTDVVVAAPGQEVGLCLTVAAGPDAVLVYDWNVDGGEILVDGDGSCVTWVADERLDSYTVACQVTDTSTDESVWGFVEVFVGNTRHQDVVLTGDCSHSGERRRAPQLAAVLSLLALVLGFRRR